MTTYGLLFRVSSGIQIQEEQSCALESLESSCLREFIIYLGDLKAKLEIRTRTRAFH